MVFILFSNQYDQKLAFVLSIIYVAVKFPGAFTGEQASER